MVVTWDLPKPILIRMTLHTGEAEEREKDYYRPAINQVARLLSSSTLFFWEPKKDGGKWEAAESYNVERDDPKEIIDKYKDADMVIRNFKQESNTVSFTIVKWPADDRRTASD